MLETSPQRRHDLDALRAFAMLLGIALHAAMSFIPAPWPVQDTHPSTSIGIFVAAVHGFRMQLFFLVSGFFTAMLWRRRGLKALLKQRFQRVLVPCILGLLTIIPTLRWVSNWAMETTKRERATNGTAQLESQLVEAMRQKDRASIERLIMSGVDPNGHDSEFSVILLSWAAMFGDAETARLLLDKGATINARNGDGSSPLHGAAFLGHNAVVAVLLSSGADAKSQNLGGDFPYDSASADWDATQYITSLLRIPLRSQKEVLAGREECQKLLPMNPARAGAKQVGNEQSRPADDFLGLRSAYRAFLLSDRLNIRRSPTSTPFHLLFTDVFDHLWFLWFLCWLVPFFIAFAWVAERRNWKGPPRKLILSPLRFFWLLPLSMIPQWFMGIFAPSFGPDTSVGLLPQPHLLLYYGVFFAFGALYFDCDDKEGQLGRWWGLAIPLALFVALPVGLVTIPSRALSGVLQLAYVWLMIFGMMGLFRRLLPHERKPVRYLSDASYWLYLVHVPFVMVLQQWIRKSALPAELKFTLICLVTTGVLLLSYQVLVRYTWLGTLLNGRREKKTG